MKVGGLAQQCASVFEESAASTSSAGRVFVDLVSGEGCRCVSLFCKKS